MRGRSRRSPLAFGLFAPLAALAAVLLLLQPFSARGRELVAAGEGRVVEVIDGDTVRLADGREVRLVGIQAPKLPLGRPNFAPWPLAEEARTALAGLLAERVVELRTGGAAADRHGRVLAHLYRVPDGTWIQGELLRQGWARVYTFPDNRTAVAEMLAHEAEARAAGRGIWGHAAYRIRTPEAVDRLIDTYQLVEGKVLRAAVVRDTVFLNFGEDWRRDFTVKIARAGRRDFRAAGLDPLTLEGRRIRVRGWLEWENGAMIAATHPEQIEMLD